nr:immunoglobulin light chain junction region [Macaca mulatta]MOX47264.1 immunoglobulin light chain junction region [Macaca mulatta]
DYCCYSTYDSTNHWVF